MASFVEQIRARMEKRQLTIAQVAEKSDISRAYLYRILDGTQTPSMEIADKIAAALDLVITTAPAR
jgi:transcriptional regulator with XRE-family HTH domain